ncbi:hypothetical protein NE237_031595 [Protea cynaroides]|uniref:Uncharacterized protein n=1 Tax=Protea cynaroides TaxID=273540 RepID=A0A9Q0R2B2_9MAGN|nr:hypothetical protein NE237_031595 [Protea cynaroides]
MDPLLQIGKAYSLVLVDLVILLSLSSNLVPLLDNVLDHCYKYGLVRATCYELHGYPPGFVRRPPKPSKNVIPQSNIASSDQFSSDNITDTVPTQQNHNSTSIIPSSSIYTTHHITISATHFISEYFIFCRVFQPCEYTNLFFCRSIFSKHIWIIDSGASHRFSPLSSPIMHPVSSFFSIPCFTS